MIDVEGAPVVLRKLEADDLGPLHSYRNDPLVRDRLVGFSVGYSQQDLADWLESHRNRNDEVLLAIARLSDNKCVGHAGLYQIDYRVGKAQFGIMIGDPESRGKGWGTAVSRKMIDFGFAELNLHKITGEFLADNKRVERMNSRLGFRTEGVLRDEVYRGGQYHDVSVMSILRHEWLECRAEE